MTITGRRATREFPTRARRRRRLGLLVRKPIDNEYDDDDDNGKTGDTGVSCSCSSSSSSICWSGKQSTTTTMTITGRRAALEFPARARRRPRFWDLGQRTRRNGKSSTITSTRTSTIEGAEPHLTGRSCPGSDKANPARPVHGSCVEGPG
jgi:hypothetical protein